MTTSPADDDEVTRVRTDDRLAKTLLLSAVAPNVPALKEVTAGRLASTEPRLDRGAAGGRRGRDRPRQGQGVAHRGAPRYTWMARARNPVIRVLLSDFDYESVVERAPW